MEGIKQVIGSRYSVVGKGRNEVMASMDSGSYEGMTEELTSI